MLCFGLDITSVANSTISQCWKCAHTTVALLLNNETCCSTLLNAFNCSTCVLSNTNANSCFAHLTGLHKCFAKYIGQNRTATYIDWIFYFHCFCDNFSIWFSNNKRFLGAFFSDGTCNWKFKIIIDIKCIFLLFEYSFFWQCVWGGLWPLKTHEILHLHFLYEKEKMTKN